AKTDALPDTASDSDIAEAKFDMAECHLEAGMLDTARESLTHIGTKAVPSGKVFDFRVKLAVLGWLCGRPTVATEEMAKATLLVDKLDYERRNRHRVMSSLLHIRRRQWAEAADLMVLTLTTYSCDDIIAYEDYVGYTVLVALASFNRSRLLKTIGGDPTVVTLSPQIPIPYSLLVAVKDFKYGDIPAALLTLEESLLSDAWYV
ncbi:26S proteasome, regulatory subunit Rpn7, partial [Kipferlia bialata]